MHSVCIALHGQAFYLHIGVNAGESKFTLRNTLNK